MLKKPVSDDERVRDEDGFPTSYHAGTGDYHPEPRIGINVVAPGRADPPVWTQEGIGHNPRDGAKNERSWQDTRGKPGARLGR